jgi:hypothetical protein
MNIHPSLLQSLCLCCALWLLAGCDDFGQGAPPPNAATPPAPAPPANSSFNPLGAFSQADLAQKRQESMQRLRQLGLALISHHDRLGKFPPAYVSDVEGKPLYSWRVLVLPYLGQQALYDRFDKTKAWDAAENIAISNTAIDAFKSPADTAVPANAVSYVAVIGDDNFFTGIKPLQFLDVLDGTSNTIALIECQGIGGSWAAPVDLKMDGLRLELGAAADQIHSPYGDGLQLLLCDGAVTFLSKDRVAALLPPMLTRGGGEVVEY